MGNGETLKATALSHAPLQGISAPMDFNVLIDLRLKVANPKLVARVKVGNQNSINLILRTSESRLRQQRIHGEKLPCNLQIMRKIIISGSNKKVWLYQSVSRGKNYSVGLQYRLYRKIVRHFSKFDLIFFLFLFYLLVPPILEHKKIVIHIIKWLFFLRIFIFSSFFPAPTTLPAHFILNILNALFYLIYMRFFDDPKNVSGRKLNENFPTNKQTKTRFVGTAWLNRLAYAKK